MGLIFVEEGVDCEVERDWRRTWKVRRVSLDVRLEGVLGRGWERWVREQIVGEWEYTHVSLWWCAMEHGRHPIAGGANYQGCSTSILAGGTGVFSVERGVVIISYTCEIRTYSDSYLYTPRNTPSTLPRTRTSKA